MRSILKAGIVVGRSARHHNQSFMDSTDIFKMCMSTKMYKNTEFFIQIPFKTIRKSYVQKESLGIS